MSKFVLLLAAGLLIQIPLIFAQDEAYEEQSVQELPAAAEDLLRAAEQVLVFDDVIDSPAPGTGPTTWAVVRMVLVLALAAAAIYGIVFFLKRASRQTPANDPFLKILANAHLGSNRYVHIVSVGNKTWLLGSCDGGVNVIGEIDDKDVINAMLVEDSRRGAYAPGRLPDFLTMLRRLGTPAGTVSPGADEIRKRRERLKGL